MTPALSAADREIVADWLEWDLSARALSPEARALLFRWSEEPRMLKGIDVSHHNGHIGWAEVRAAGVEFAYLKATEGNSYTDLTFARNRHEAKAAGLVVGAYHFLRPDADPVAQAHHFLAVAKPLPGELPPALDVESFAGTHPAEMTAKVGAWLKTVEAVIGRRCVIYCSPASWDESVGGDFSGHPLWIASYRPDAPRLPHVWKAWTFWQYADHGTVPGVPGERTVDLDRFNGDRAALEAFCLGAK